MIVTDQPPVTADMIGDLAGALGLDAEALEHTVAEYTAAVGPGEFDPYGLDGRRTVGSSRRSRTGRPRFGHRRTSPIP